MDDHHAKNITNWLIQSGLKGLPEEDLLAGFCERCNAGGLQIDRASAVMDTLHPVYERRAYRWDRSPWMQRVFEFGFANPGGIPSDWQRSAFHYLKRTGGTQVRRRLLNGDPADFFLVDTMKRDGFTDFIATAHRFDDPGALGGIDCFFSQFGTRVPDGFSEADEQALRDLLPCLALAVKCVVVPPPLQRSISARARPTMCCMEGSRVAGANASLQRYGFPISPTSPGSRTRSILKRSFPCSMTTPTR